MEHGLVREMWRLITMAVYEFHVVRLVHPALRCLPILALDPLRKSSHDSLELSWFDNQTHVRNTLVAC